MALHTWLLFVTAVFGLALTPGPNGLLALSHGALYGHRKTLFTVSGGVIGFTLLMALSMLGIGTLLQASAQALSILKWLGGAYLIWLGIQLWRAPPLHLAMAEKTTNSSAFKLFRQGLLSALSNPQGDFIFRRIFAAVSRPARGSLAAVRHHGADLCRGRRQRRIPAGAHGPSRSPMATTQWQRL